MRPNPSTTSSASSERDFRVAATSRFGRAPRILPVAQAPKRASSRRSEVEREFEDGFTRAAHLQRYRGIRDSIQMLGDVTERVCRNYATFSNKGQQFAVVKPLSDGGIRIGVALGEGCDVSDLDAASGLGGSSRVQHQFELESFEVLSGVQLSYLRRAFECAASPEAELA